MKIYSQNKFYFILILISLFSFGCEGEFNKPEDMKVINAKKAKVVEVYFKAIKADMIISSGGENLMLGKFNYYMPTSRTVVDYHEEAEVGKLDIYDKFFPSIGVYPKENRLNLWHIILGQTLPLTGRIDLAQGTFLFDASNININRMELGLGKVQGNINLVKEWKNSFYAAIRLEEGELIIQVPSGMGVRIELEEEGQNIEADGFKKDGRLLTNDYFKKENLAIRLYIHAGQGQIKVLTESLK